MAEDDILARDPNARFLRFARMWFVTTQDESNRLRGRDVMRFNLWCKRAGLEPLAVLEKDVEPFIEWMAAKPFADRTITHARQTLRRLRDFLLEPIVEA